MKYFLFIVGALCVLGGAALWLTGETVMHQDAAGDIGIAGFVALGSAAVIEAIEVGVDRIRRDLRRNDPPKGTD